MKWITICCVALNICNAGAEPIPLPQLPEPTHADSEVSTNLPFNTARSDAREFGVAMAFAGTASNCVQVAFGHDADGDGDLSADEARLSIGWRAGSYFIEDVANRHRLTETANATSGEARSFSLHVVLGRSSRPTSVSATNESGRCFLSLSDAAPGWLYNTDWNLLKVTRRGVNATEETVAVDCRYNFFNIRIR